MTRRRRRLVLAARRARSAARACTPRSDRGTAHAVHARASRSCSSSLVPVVRLAGVSERLAFTGLRVVLVVFCMLPWSAWEAVFGALAMDFSTWIVAGLMVVVGAVWMIVFNADLLLGGATKVARALPRAGADPPHVDRVPAVRRASGPGRRSRCSRSWSSRSSPAPPSTGRSCTRSASRTSAAGSTCAPGTAASGADRRHARGAARRRASSEPTSPSSAASPCSRSRRRQVGRGTSGRDVSRARPRRRVPRTHDVRAGRDGARATAPSARSGTAMADGPASRSWTASSSRAATTRNFGVPPDFQLTGFYYEEGAFDPIPVEVLDAQTGRRARG